MLGLIFVIVLIVLILLTVIALLYVPVKHGLEKRLHKKRVYKTVRYFADEQDCYLLNDVHLFTDASDSEPVAFEHLIFGEKYVYIISTFVGFGGVYGNLADSNLFMKKSNGDITNIPNPVLLGKERVRQLEGCLMAKHDKHMFVAITVYNPSLVVPKGIHVRDSVSCFLPINELEDTLMQAEKDSVTTLSDEVRNRAVNLIKARSDEIKKTVENSKRKKK